MKPLTKSGNNREDNTHSNLTKVKKKKEKKFCSHHFNVQKVKIKFTL